MESAIEYSFLNLEYFLINFSPSIGTNQNEYNKIVLCPLIIDFGYKNLDNKDCFYNLPPSKPIVNQVVDLFNAIYFYYHFDISRNPDKRRLTISPIEETFEDAKNRKILEIYPFLGINTQNYEYNDIVDLFSKYFAGYDNDTPATRKDKLFNKLGSMSLSLEELITYKKPPEELKINGQPPKELKTDDKADVNKYTYLFAGIKLYPPLGFDPWPDEKKELDKVKLLYSECIKKKLPVIVHCSDGGFITDPNYYKLTSPAEKWQKILANPEYKDLKIDFAHMGCQSGFRTKWRKTILNFIESNPNVYTDCSCITPDIKDYKKIKKVINKTKKQLLFGTDFSINLLTSKSYNDYLINFLQTPYLSFSQKEDMCMFNSEKFLFGCFCLI
jgi:predicted TIM-barrel fold metal-dependent hydrolase